MASYVKFLLAAIGLWWLPPAFGVDTNVTPGMMANFKSATSAINSQLVAPALATASAALILQWVATHWKDVFTGDISNTLAKSVGVISWYGFAVFLINHQSEFGSYFDKYTALAGSLSNLNSVQFSPGGLIDNAVGLVKASNVAFSKASDTHWWQVGDNMFAALLLAFANIFTFLSFLVIALSVFVAQLEFWMMFSVAPLAFALIPLAAFRDQGIAPIKGLMSLGLRIVILGVVVSIANKLTNDLINLFNAGLPSGDSIYDPVWYYLAGMAACAMMALSAGKIASSIASGSASFSGSDAIQGGMKMATTAAMGAAAVTGAAALAGKIEKSGAAGAMGHSAGKGMGNLLSGGPSPLGVSPSGSQLGGSLNEGPPPLSGGSSGGPSSGNAPAMSLASGGGGSSGGAPSGDASSAGISGGGAPSGGAALEQKVANMEKSMGKGPSNWDKLKGASRSAAEANAADQHQVGVQINTRGE